MGAGMIIAALIVGSSPKAAEAHRTPVIIIGGVLMCASVIAGWVAMRKRITRHRAENLNGVDQTNVKGGK